MVESFSLNKLLCESIAGAVRVSFVTYGCIREIFESRYLRGVANERDVGDEPAGGSGGGGGAAATASVHIKNTELKLKRNEKERNKQISW